MMAMDYRTSIQLDFIERPDRATQSILELNFYKKKKDFMTSVIWRALFCVFNFSLISSCALSGASNDSCESRVMTYQYPGANFAHRYDGIKAWYVLEEQEVIHGEYPLIDCSTAELLCVMTYNQLFVVPRGPISTGERYVVRGGQIDTEGCFRYSGDVCVSALFISDCRAAAEAPKARNARSSVDIEDCRANGFGQRLMYIFDRERGIIAYEPADYWQLGTDVSKWDLSTIGVSAGLLALVGEFGLLACESSSQAAIFRQSLHEQNIGDVQPTLRHGEGTE